MTPAERPPRLVLVVDDEPHVAALLGRLLEADGHQVAVAHDGREALERVAAARPDLVVLDLDMPWMGGFEVCRRLRAEAETRLTPVLILSGRDPSETRIQAWELGADEYLCKPFRNHEVVARCRSLLRHKELVDELETAQTVMFAFARAVEAKSPYTQGHSERVAHYAHRLAERAGFARADLDLLRRGAALHDVGKVGTPDAVLDKPGKLTPEEYEVIKRHPADGARIVEPLRSLRDTIPLIRWHHERLDGKGYPDGLAGAAIPPLVRVLSVADVYDALSSERPYRPAMPHGRCLDVMASDSGSGLDADLLALFRETVRGPVPTPPAAATAGLTPPGPSGPG